MTIEASETVCCGNPACKVAETGKCIEGLEVQTCPNYGKTPGSIDDAAPFENEASTVTSVVFSGGQKLTVSEAIGLLRKRSSRVIAIIGPHDAGKTSLIACLYELFQEGPIGGIEFATSSTLHAFEAACHDTRMESGRETPETERTKRGGVGFYHLEVGKTQDYITLLLGDRAGEEYLEGSDDITMVYDFSEICRADVITLLVDGDRLINLESRHNVIARIERILQALDGAKVISSRQRLALVLTKLDAIRDSPDSERAILDFSKLEANIRARYTNVFTSIEPFEVAASPKSTSANLGHGVEALLSCWLMPQQCPIMVMPDAVVPARAIGRLTILVK